MIKQNLLFAAAVCLGLWPSYPITSISPNISNIIFLQDTSSADTDNSSADELTNQPMPAKRRRVTEAFRIVSVEYDERYESPDEEKEHL